MVVSASPAGLSRADYMKTRAIINADLQPTASFVINPDIDFEIGAMQRAICDAVGDDHLDIVDATGIATALLGDSIATNAFMLGGHGAGARGGALPGEA
jgi:indolepyruvate ferredoxin oxidoreductase